MRLSDYLLEIAESYDSNAGLSTPTQLLLRNADSHLAEHVPVEFIIKGSGGQGVPTFTPWISFLLPKETTTVQDGLYVVYLFSRDLKRVTLTLMHGVTNFTNSLGTKAARVRLGNIAADVRIGLPEVAVAAFDTRLELGVGGWRQRAYVASTIVAKEYFFGSFPPEQDLINDLNAFLDLYHTVTPSSKHVDFHRWSVPPLDRRTSGPQYQLVDLFDADVQHQKVVIGGRLCEPGRRRRNLVRHMDNHSPIGIRCVWRFSAFWRAVPRRTVLLSLTPLDTYRSQQPLAVIPRP